MKRRSHVYIVGTACFIKSPEVRGLWIKTDSSVMLAACSYCGAKKGEMCISRAAAQRRYTAGTHTARRLIARMERLRIRRRLKSTNTIVTMEVWP